jgi:hypothetical protein
LRSNCAMPLAPDRSLPRPFHVLHHVGNDPSLEASPGQTSRVSKHRTPQFESRNIEAIDIPSFSEDWRSWRSFSLQVTRPSACELNYKTCHRTWLVVVDENMQRRPARGEVNAHRWPFAAHPALSRLTLRMLLADSAHPADRKQAQCSTSLPSRGSHTDWTSCASPRERDQCQVPLHRSQA